MLNADHLFFFFQCFWRAAILENLNIETHVQLRIYCRDTMIDKTRFCLYLSLYPMFPCLIFCNDLITFEEAERRKLSGKN